MECQCVADCSDSGFRCEGQPGLPDENIVIGCKSSDDEWKDEIDMVIHLECPAKLDRADRLLKCLTVFRKAAMWEREIGRWGNMFYNCLDHEYSGY